MSNIYELQTMKENDMTDFAKLDEYLEDHLDESIAELSRLVAQPSVGAQNWGMEECAELVAEMLRQRGFCRPGDAHRRRAGGLWRARRAQSEKPC